MSTNLKKVLDTPQFSQHTKGTNTAVGGGSGSGSGGGSQKSTGTATGHSVTSKTQRSPVLTLNLSNL